MLLRWIKSVVDGQPAGVTGQGAVELEKQRKEAKLIDVAHEALSREAAAQGADLNGLVKYGWPRVKREKFKGSVRKRVWDLVKRNFGAEDADIVEEVTERIVDAAEVDPYYQKLFEEKKV